MTRRHFCKGGLLVATAVLGQEREEASRQSMTNMYYFRGGAKGPWRVTHASAFRGAPLPTVQRIDVTQVPDATASSPSSVLWTLQGFTSNLRYATSDEVTTLKARQEPPGRAEATQAALIPIKKNQRWWDLAQDERRRIFEETSHHTAIGLDYLPAIARRLHHSRDINGEFDFITWFEFAPKHAGAFDELLKRLRATPEWEFVEREVELRLERNA